MAAELGIPVDTLYDWQKTVREGRSDTGAETRTIQEAMTLAEEVAALRKQFKEPEKENRQLKEENEFLEEASALFRRRSSEAGKEQRMKFTVLKTEDGVIKGKLSLYRLALEVSRKGFYKHLPCSPKSPPHRAAASAHRKSRLQQKVWKIQQNEIRIPFLEP